MDFSHHREAISLCHCIYLVLVEVSQLTGTDRAKTSLVNEVSYSNAREEGETWAKHAMYTVCVLSDSSDTD